MINVSLACLLSGRLLACRTSPPRFRLGLDSRDFERDMEQLIPIQVGYHRADYIGVRIAPGHYCIALGVIDEKLLATHRYPLPRQSVDAIPLRDEQRQMVAIAPIPHLGDEAIQEIPQACAHELKAFPL